MRATSVNTTTAILSADIKPGGKPTRYEFLYGIADCATTPEACTEAPPEEEEAEVSGTSSQHVEVPITGLTAATAYHFLLIAHNPDGEVESKEKTFTTYASPLSGLPDGRAYEQASPVDKDASDAMGKQALVKATPEGNGITFAATFGIPGGKGVGAFPSYLATRGEGSWSTQGLLPPIKYGERNRVVGWSPDFSKIYTRVGRLGKPRTEALLEESSLTGEATVIGPYVPESQYFYAGQSADGQVVLFETHAALPPAPGGEPIPGAVQGQSNLYAWDRETEEIHLAGVSNEETALGEGSFAGPYDWALGTNGFNLREGGAQRSYYLADTHAIAPDGSVYFTAAGTGQLYLRENPTEEQSEVVINGEGEEECTEPALACTIHLSASHRTKADPAGEQPAAFQAASPDGKEAYFTSPQMLTDDAYTGPEQPEASIARDTIDGKAESIEPDFIKRKAIGVAVAGSHIYWANPASGTIERSDLNGENIETFVAIPEVPAGECEEEVRNKETELLEFVPSQPIPADPQYVAVQGEYIYWTNTGRRDAFDQPIDGTGTIGRAKLVGETVEEVDPAFICGENSAEPSKRLISNPQGIAVDSTYIYWANASPGEGIHRSIARAKVDGGEVIETFVATTPRAPFGVTLSATHIYFTEESEGNNNGFIARAPLKKPPGMTEEKSLLPGEAGVRGIALDSEHVYWVSQKEETIGRADLELESFENPFIKTKGAVNGIAVDATHILWSVNGELPGNPGNDLYRFKAPGGSGAGTLTDLTADHEAADKKAGADVQGLVAASGDGSRVYVAANGSLDGGGPGGGGTCTRPQRGGKGKCSLYLLEAGTASLVAALRLGGGEPDSLNWVGTPVGSIEPGTYTPKRSSLAEDGETLFFQSHEKLTAYDNEGTPELYRYRPGVGIGCVSCRPTGEEAEGGPGLGSVEFPGTNPSMAIEGVASRNFSPDGRRAFFETTEALSPEDTNGQGGCPLLKGHPACLDVYEWEAAGEGSCEEGNPAYSALNEGCLFLISTGKSKFPSYFADASESGNDVFFFTRQSLVGQDQDELQDVYDARVGGGLPSQNALPPVPCEGIDACHGPEQERQSEGEAASQGFVGPENPKPKHKKSKQKKHTKKHKKHKNHRRQGRAGTKGGH